MLKAVFGFGVVVATVMVLGESFRPRCCFAWCLFLAVPVGCVTLF